MRTHLRKIGNSKGVLLPSALLAESGITDEIEIRMEEGKLIIEPVQKLREGWFDGYCAEEDNVEDWPDTVRELAGSWEDFPSSNENSSIAAADAERESL